MSDSSQLQQSKEPSCALNMGKPQGIPPTTKHKEKEKDEKKGKQPGGGGTHF